jgi:hypothetical protein
MSLIERFPGVRVWLVVIAVGLSACAPVIRPTMPPSAAALQMAEFWEEPTDLETRDLLHGLWGVERAPDPNGTYAFFRKKRSGNNPGVTVTDTQGREWHVKQGTEAQPEVVLSHVLWALGYHQPPVYYLPSFMLADSSGTGTHTEPGGRFRLSDASLKNRGPWSWQQNPYVGTTPYQGLLVILVTFNSADLKNENNTLYEVKRAHHESQWWYAVRDLGSSLGATGRFNPKENDPNLFDRRGFITGVTDGYVEFDYGAINKALVHHRITPADVRWATGLLARLTDRQWADAFRGAGYEPPVANRFIRRLHEKIAEGQCRVDHRLDRVGRGD